MSWQDRNTTRCSTVGCAAFAGFPSTCASESTRSGSRSSPTCPTFCCLRPTAAFSPSRKFPISLVIPAPFLARDLRPQLANSELLQLLRAIGEETRLRALQLIAEAPRSTRELAPLLDISEAGLSKHLRLLADAGVLESHREGYYVVYELVPERLDQISRTLVDYVNRPEASS